MKLNGITLMIIGILLLVSGVYLAVEQTEIINSSFGFLLVIAIALFGVISMGAGSSKYMRGE
jgi:hypothetical protein